ncbi:MAG: DMT family transporter [Desulfovibrio aminophilus]|jgi:drug/metabolite transporter (DMT)-like permease|uniref:DMT family transporter n=1 Tax=Desulfovibrio aminophilus TaxID=81425 RepID=UPI0004855761|nr:DMT family transporter [Desulfovibrio aminophilus]
MSTLAIEKARKADLGLSLTHAKKGLGWGLLSGIAWGLDATLLAIAFTLAPLAGIGSAITASLVGTAGKEGFGGLWVVGNCLVQGKGAEILRALKTKPGRLCCLAGLLGGPIAMSCYVFSVYAAGPAYAVSIATLYPLFGAVFAMPILKEKMQPKVLAGIGICVIGAIVISYSPADLETYPNFYWGLFFGLLANVAWGMEAVVSTFGMDLLDSDVVLSIRYLTSALLYILIILPLAGGLGLAVDLLTTAESLSIFVAIGLTSSLAYLAWYKAMNMTGVARANALNNTHLMFGIFFSWMILDSEITLGLIVGSVLILFGSLSALTDKEALFNLRKV